MSVRNAGQPPVPPIVPRVIGAGQPLPPAAAPVDDPRPTVAAHVEEGPHLPAIAADDDYTFAEIFERAPLAGMRDLALVADDLRRRTQKRSLLRLEELRVEIEPAWQAHVVERIRRRLDRSQVRGHGPAVPRQGPGRQSGAVCRLIA